jgi:hypothetical protein
MVNQGHRDFSVPQAVSTALLSGTRAPCALWGPILRRRRLATSLVPDNPAKRTADPPTRLRPGRTLRVKACNPRQPGPMGQGPTSTPSPVRQFSHQSCRDLSCTRSHANLCWYLPRPFRTVRQLSSGQQTAVAEVALFNRRRQLCLWLVLACLDDCGDCFRVYS